MAKYTLRSRYDPGTRLQYTHLYALIIDNDGDLRGWNIGPKKAHAKQDLKDLVGKGMEGWDNDDDDVTDAIMWNPHILVESDKFVAIEDYIENNLD